MLFSCTDSTYLIFSFVIIMQLGNKSLIALNLFTLLLVRSSKALICFCPCFAKVFIFFSNTFPSDESVNLACSITLYCCRGNISSPVTYSYFPILPDDKSDIFAASFLNSYFIFFFFSSLNFYDHNFHDHSFYLFYEILLSA